MSDGDVSRSMRDFRRALRSAPGKLLAYQIRDGFGAGLAGLLERVARGDKVHDGELLGALDQNGMGGDFLIATRLGFPQIIPGARGARATAVVPVRGVALYAVELQPFCFSTLHLARTVTALVSDSEIGSIVLDIDSPGGQVTGTPEAADAIYAARIKKPVIAMVNPLAASAAYWIASQASEVVTVPSGDVGSIGVFMAHTDCSKFNEKQGVRITYIYDGEYKVEGNPDEPLSDQARAHYQSEVDAIGRQFRRAVARGRGVSVEKVESDFGKGRTMMAAAAKRAGLVDRIVSGPDEVFTAGSGMSRAARLEHLRISTPHEKAQAERRARLDQLKH